MSTSARRHSDSPTAWVPKRRSCDCGGSCGKCTANGGLGVMEQVEWPGFAFGRRCGTWTGEGRPNLARAVQRDDDTGATNTSYGPGETQASRPWIADIQRAVDAYRGWEMPEYWRIPENANRRCEMLGEEEDCDPPLREVRDVSDVDELDIVAAAQTVRLIGFDAEEEDLMLRGWALLRQHFHLAMWIVCVIGGPQSWIKVLCLAGYVLGGQGFPSMTPMTFRAVGRSPRSIFHSCDWLGGASLAMGRNWLPGDNAAVIYICVAHRNWSRYLTLMQQRRPFRMCAVIRVASLIFHELLHVCLIAGPDGDEDDPSNCYESYRMDESFTWALYQIYPSAGSNACCDSHASERTFNSQLVRNVNLDCLART